jgi:glycosyltransferase involved in cell wall biosynthesis
VRAVFLCPTLAVGGAERLLSTLVLQLRDRGVEPAVVTLNHEGRFFHELAQEGVEVHFAGMRSRYDAVAGRRAYALVRSAAPNVVVTQSVDAHVIGHLAARRERVPHVTIEHAGPGLIPVWHRRLLTRLIAPHVDLTVAVTAVQELSLRALGYREGRIRVIPNGVVRPEPTRGAASVRAELGVGTNDLLALFVATLRPEKQATLFVDAVAAARRLNCPVRGVVVGSGPDLSTVVARAEQVEGVSVLGERSDVPDLMAAADLVCLTSRAEALPMVVLEALALGRPIVSTAVGGIPEVVTPDVGILVPPGSVNAVAEAMCIVAGDPARRKAMGKAALARYRAHYTIERVADSYLRALHDVIAARGQTLPTAAVLHEASE